MRRQRVNSRKSARGRKKLGAEILEGLKEFRDALVKGERIDEKFTVRTMELQLEPQEYDPEDVRVTRARLHASQAVFACLLGVSVKTVQAMEQGINRPTKPVRRLLDEMNRSPEDWIKRYLRSSNKREPATA